MEKPGRSMGLWRNENGVLVCKQTHPIAMGLKREVGKARTPRRVDIGH